MAYQVQCSFCHKINWIQHRYFHKHCDEFNIQSHKIEDFNKVYMCVPCRKRHRRIGQPNSLQETSEYKSFSSLLQLEFDEWIRRGRNDPIAFQNFKKNVESLLDKYMIKQYSLEIRNGELFGILLKQVPFFGDILVKLNNKGR